MAKAYELLVVLNPTIGEEALQEQVDKITALIAENGSVTDTDIWGNRKLAYEINDLSEGYYVLMHFSAEPEFPSELERQLGINDKVLRYLTTVVEE